MRVFGCAAYAHIPNDERKKFDLKSKRCILLGYGTEVKGYRLYDPVRCRVIFSRDVVFNESKLGIEENQEKQSESHRIEIQSDSGDQDVSVGSEIIDKEVNEEEMPELRRSQRTRQKPDYYGVWVNAMEDLSEEPATFKDALASPDKDKWRDAMQKEIQSLAKNHVWDHVESPKDRQVVGSKWVFRRKVGENGVVERYKARLVAQGYSQKFGQDYEETFSPLVRFESIRMIISLAAQYQLKLYQMDVTTAFLNGELEEEVYMRQPEGFIAEGQEHLVCKLKRSIYGLRQSPRCWYFALDCKLKEMGFRQTPSDPCLYVSTEGEMFFVDTM